MTLFNPFLRFMDRLYGTFIYTGSNLQSVFLLYMRLTWGHQFLITGLTKFHSIEEVIQFFITLGFSTPKLAAYFVGSIEVAGGILLILGLASRLVGLLLSILMIIALSTAHAPNLTNFRFLTEPHLLVLQQPYPYLITALLVFFFGPGRISIDAWIKRWVDHQPRY